MASSLTNPAKAKTYAAPKLIIYGNARTLTAAGTGSQTENGTKPSCQTNVNRKPCP